MIEENAYEIDMLPVGSGWRYARIWRKAGPAYQEILRHQPGGLYGLHPSG